MIDPEILLADYEPRFRALVGGDDSAARDEKLLLVSAILALRPSVIVETGTHRGLTALYLGVAAREVGATVHTYDPFEWGAASNIGQFPELPVTYRKAPGASCDLQSVDFAFVDGYHQAEHVAAEIDALLPRLSDGAVVYFHDTAGSNVGCDVPGGIASRGLEVEYLATTNGMARYVHTKTK